IAPLSGMAISAFTIASLYASSQRSRAKHVPDSATRKPPRSDIRATARPTSPLKNLIPSICSVGVIDRRQLIAVARNQTSKFESAEISRDKNARLPNGTQEPAEIKTIGPHRNRRLIAGEKCERSPNTITRRAYPQILL